MDLNRDWVYEMCPIPTPSDKLTYEEHRNALITYLMHKVAISDWHGVSDAANDLRVLEAQEEMKNARQC